MSKKLECLEAIKARLTEHKTPFYKLLTNSIKKLKK